MNRNLTFISRILSYEIKKHFSHEAKKIDIDLKLVKLYSRLGKYSKAIACAENLYRNKSYADIGFVLSNLYVLNGEQEKSELLLSEKLDLGEDIISSINLINDCINYDQMFYYITYPTH